MVRERKEVDPDVTVVHSKCLKEMVVKNWRSL